MNYTNFALSMGQSTISQAWRALLFLFFSIPNFSYADSFEDKFFDLPSYWEQAVSKSSNIRLGNEHSLFRWPSEELKIAVFFEGTDKKSILSQMNTAFEGDRKFIEEATGISISLGLWEDEDPAPSIYVLIGNKVELLSRSNYLTKRFGYPSFPSELAKHAARGRPLCYLAQKSGGKGSLSLAVITVDRDHSPSYCLRLQLLAALGLTGTLADQAPSILSSSRQFEYYQELDKILLGILYQPSIDLTDPSAAIKAYLDAH